VEVRQAARAAVVLAPARGHQGDQAQGEGPAQQRGAGDVVAPPAPTADGLLAGPALQAAEGRQEFNRGEGGHGIGREKGAIQSAGHRAGQATEVDRQRHLLRIVNSYSREHMAGQRPVGRYRQRNG